VEKTHACRPALPQSSPLVRKQVVGYFDCGEDFAIRSSARLTSSSYSAATLSIICLDARSDVFRHSTSIYGAGAPMTWII
jgi:hypothetical protein